MRSPIINELRCNELGVSLRRGGDIASSVPTEAVVPRIHHAHHITAVAHVGAGCGCGGAGKAARAV